MGGGGGLVVVEKSPRSSEKIMIFTMLFLVIFSIRGDISLSVGTLNRMKASNYGFRGSGGGGA
jgi:hypothetical protein